MTPRTINTTAILADLTDAAAEWERQGGERALVAVDLHVVAIDHDITEEQAADIAREAGIAILD